MHLRLLGEELEFLIKICFASENNGEPLHTLGACKPHSALNAQKSMLTLVYVFAWQTMQLILGVVSAKKKFNA